MTERRRTAPARREANASAEGAAEPRLFRSLAPDAKIGWRPLAVGIALHLGAIAVLLALPVLLVRQLGLPEPAVALLDVFIIDEIPEDLGPTIPEPEAPPPVPEPVAEPETEPTIVQPPPPEIAQRPPEAPVPPPPVVVREVKPLRKVETTDFDAPPPATPVAAKREVRTDLLAAAESATKGGGAPAKQIQTGGFGDPNGIEGSERTYRSTARAQLGSFDLPAGPGLGNGAGGGSGLRGAIATAGFGDGGAAAGRTSGRIPARANVKGAGFADGAPASEPAKPRRRPSADPGSEIEIVSKPKPAYTEEARNSRVEGEVVLEVRFRSTGESEVVRVVSGLGHGLDEEAVRAARKIVFKPARRDGEPVDFTAYVRMVFQLT